MFTNFWASGLVRRRRPHKKMSGKINKRIKSLSLKECSKKGIRVENASDENPKKKR